MGRHVTTLAGGSEEGAADRAGPAGASIWLALDEIRHCSLGARSELAAKSCPLKDYADWRCNKKVPEFFPKTLAAPMLFGRTSGHESGRGKAKCSTETASKFDNLVLMEIGQRKTAEPIVAGSVRCAQHGLKLLKFQLEVCLLHACRRGAVSRQETEDEVGRRPPRAPHKA